MKLWLDAGNTRVKWQLYQDDLLLAAGGLVHCGDLSSAMSSLVGELQEFITGSAVQFAGLASVLNQEALAQLRSACKTHLNCELQCAQVSRELKGVTCAYEDVSRLGVDRWLALVAAFNQCQKAVCVVDCGSALTIDMVNNAGEHMGGFILPGLNMSVRALLGQTHSVRFTEGHSAGVSLGRDTASAVLNGALLQAQASIKEAKCIFEIDYLANKSNDSACFFITGGDADRVLDGLNLNFIQQDDLVIQGLRLALE